MIRHLLIVAAFILTASLTSSEKKELSESDLQVLYSPAFSNFQSSYSQNRCCDYGKVRSGDEQYFEGLKGIFLYGGYARSGVNNLLAKNKKSKSEKYQYSDFYDISVYERLVGTNAFISKNSEVLTDPASFDRYNPEFIQWVVDNAIPDSDFTIGGVTAQYVYDHYSRFFRLFVESYLYLQKGGSYDDEANYYITEVEKNGEDGLDVLFGRYHYALSDYEIPTESVIPSPLEAHMAFGFWLRRNLDGTHDEIYSGLSKIMDRFDRRWFKFTQGKYLDKE